MLLRYLFFAVVFSASLPSLSLAHPVSFKGGYGVMPEYSPSRQEVEVNYSLTSSYALALHAINADLKSGDSKFILPRFNYKLFRRNELDSQTNLYLWAGGGAAEQNDNWQLSSTTGFQADYETRRIYTLLLGENLQSTRDADSKRLRYRLGVAPYLASFEGFHTWLIAQVEYTPDMDNSWTVTPLVRFFYNNYLIEVGSSTRGDLFAAGIFHF